MRTLEDELVKEIRCLKAKVAGHNASKIIFAMAGLCLGLIGGATIYLVAAPQARHYLQTVSPTAEKPITSHGWVRPLDPSHSFILKEDQEVKWLDNGRMQITTTNGTYDFPAEHMVIFESHVPQSQPHPQRATE